MKKSFAIITSLIATSVFAQTAEVLNPDVRSDTLSATICMVGYTKTVRPATSYTNGVKKKLLREQGLDFMEHKKEYELDHIIPLTLGGHPRNIHNLMLQKWEGEDGAKVKDKLEVRLSKMVCKGKISLTAAQTCIWKDWAACAVKYKGRTR